MSNAQPNSLEKPERKAFMARLSWEAYEAIFETQRKIRQEKGILVTKGEILDVALIEYAKKHGIKINQ